MTDPKDQVADVNHFDNKIVVKYEDGTVTMLDGQAVRKHVDARDTPQLKEKEPALESGGQILSPDKDRTSDNLEG